MRYKLYTTVDITHTGQYRNEPGKETLRWKEQNFQTVLQTLGIRANILFDGKPEALDVKGTVVGLDVKEIVHVWRFDFETEREYLFDVDDNPIGYLLDDFELVPYISGLDESMTQNYDIFVTRGPSRNISFYKNE
jgi:hypothetical protein